MFECMTLQMEVPSEESQPQQSSYLIANIINYITSGIELNNQMPQAGPSSKPAHDHRHPSGMA